MRDSECHVGDKIGHLTLLEKTRMFASGSNRISYICKCDCGKVVTRTVNSLRPNASCGAGLHNRKYWHPEGITKKEFSKIYITWYKIKLRCEDPNDKDYPRYGGRGISMCKEWHNLDNFTKWYWEESKHRIISASEQTVDRINVNKGYSPDNCRLVDVEAQSNNRRTNKIVYIFNEPLTYSEAAKKYNIKKDTIRWRALHGRKGQELIQPNQCRNIYNIFGEQMSLKDISRRYGIAVSTLHRWTRNNKNEKYLEAKIEQYEEELNGNKQEV